MEEDFMHSLGYLALAARFKRLSDAMIHSGRQMYKSLGWDIEPNWYLVFRLLEEKGSRTITQMAEDLGYAHPSMITMIKKMQAADYVISVPDETDGRKQWIQLTKRATDRLPEFHQLWDAGTAWTEDLLPSETGFLAMLAKLEAQLKEKDFKDRTLDRFRHEK
ncbi:MAG: MarR family transcriptional regulator [Bacteroidota bacterium]